MTQYYPIRLLSVLGWMLAGLCLLINSGCHDPTAGKADAGSSAAKDEVISDVAASDFEFLLDADNTDIKWTGSNAIGQTPYGYFYKLTGKVVYDDREQQLKHFEVLIDMNEIKAMDEALTKKLKTKGFFQVDKYPEARFVSTRFESQAGAEATDIVEGNLQIRDTTKSITIPLYVEFANGKLKMTSEFKINRKDYGVVYSDAAGDAVIRDDVLINISIGAESTNQ